MRALPGAETVLRRQNVLAEHSAALADTDRRARRDEHGLLVAGHALAQEAEVLEALAPEAAASRINAHSSAFGTASARSTSTFARRNTVERLWTRSPGPSYGAPARWP